jgi:hypothetical protein
VELDGGTKEDVRKEFVRSQHVKIVQPAAVFSSGSVGITSDDSAFSGNPVPRVERGERKRLYSESEERVRANMTLYMRGKKLEYFSI